MQRSMLAPIVTLLLFSGCASPAEQDSIEPTTSTAFTAVADNRLPPPTTDTYHLLALPDVTPVAPTGSEPVRIPVRARTAYSDTVGETPVPWTFNVPQDLVAFQGVATIFVEVKGTITGNP